MNKCILPDSSIWIEIISKNDAQLKKQIFSFEKIIVPTIILFEVYKKIKIQVNEEKSLQVIAYLNEFETVDLDRSIALLGADLSIQYKLGMADALILAHAHTAKALLLTMDYDFLDLPLVKVIKIDSNNSKKIT